MEYEVRFYYPLSKKDELLKKLSSYDNLTVGERKYEKTTQYDHPCIDNSFYSKNIYYHFLQHIYLFRRIFFLLSAIYNPEKVLNNLENFAI